MTGTLTVGDVIAALGRRAPAARAAAWDPVGLQIGDAGAPITSAAVCHEVTDEVVTRVEGGAVDLLVSYHPLLFRPTTRIAAGPGAAGRAYRLARAGVSLVVAHTNHDVAPGGAADALAAALGLADTVPFGPLWGGESVRFVTFVPPESADRVAAAMAAAGAGAIGRYTDCSFRTAGTGTFFAPDDARPAVGAAGRLNREPEIRLEMVAPAARSEAVAAALAAAHPYEEPAFDVIERRGDAGFVGRVGRLEAPATGGDLAALVADRLGGVVRAAGDPRRLIERAAVVPGSGGDFAAAASAAGADVLITGDVSHHRARAALDLGLSLVDPGHAATERPGIATLYAAVSRVVPVARHLEDLDPDPWRAA